MVYMWFMVKHRLLVVFWTSGFSFVKVTSWLFLQVIILPGQAFSPWSLAACLQHPCWPPCTQWSPAAPLALTAHPDKAGGDYRASWLCDWENKERSFTNSISDRVREWKKEDGALPVKLLGTFLSFCSTHQTVSQYGPQVSVLRCFFLQIQPESCQLSCTTIVSTWQTCHSRLSTNQMGSMTWCLYHSRRGNWSSLSPGTIFDL